MKYKSLFSSSRNTLIMSQLEENKVGQGDRKHEREGGLI